MFGRATITLGIGPHSSFMSINLQTVHSDAQYPIREMFTLHARHRAAYHRQSDTFRSAFSLRYDELRHTAVACLYQIRRAHFLLLWRNGVELSARWFTEETKPNTVFQTSPILRTYWNPDLFKLAFHVQYMLLWISLLFCLHILFFIRVFLFSQSYI